MKEYSIGVHDISPVAVPQEARHITVGATRIDWPDTGRDVISVRIEFSGDGGRSWGYLYGFKTSGGELKDRKTGEIAQRSWVRFVLADAGSPGRMVRGTVECFTSLKTEVAITFE